jgi:hypothetical protein
MMQKVHHSNENYSSISTKCSLATIVKFLIYLQKQNKYTKQQLLLCNMEGNGAAVT